MAVLPELGPQTLGQVEELPDYQKRPLERDAGNFVPEPSDGWTSPSPVIEAEDQMVGMILGLEKEENLSHHNRGL